MNNELSELNINEVIVEDIKQLVNQLSHSNSPSDDKEIKWLLENCNNITLKNIIPSLTVLMLHVLEAIKISGPVNCARISEKTTIPKGTVSKVAKKLINHELITMSLLENNKKERLYGTTEIGAELAILHDKLHKNIEGEFSEFLNKYQTSELELFSKMLNDFKEFYFD